MKYGRQLEHDSVPEWSLHNLDYNSLKHEIKVHTTRDQATAIAIPGHTDPALRKFEDGLYLELCRQHDRVDLFVSSKADEIARRLDSISGNIRRWVARCPDELNATAALKRQRRLAKYERELRRCEDDIHALERFAKAQIVAFRKIVKKYKKWTGSTSLGARFADSVLSNPKSFTRRDFNHLQLLHDDILTGLRAATPLLSEPTSSSDEPPSPVVPHTPRRQQPRADFQPLPPSDMNSPQTKYWNEYDDGSDAGPEDDYAIFIDPDGDNGFPGFGYVQAVLSLPFERAKQWFRPERPSERQPLISPENSNLGYASTTANSDSDEESTVQYDGFPQHGYAALYAFPSIGEQKVARYRENVLMWATMGGFLASFILLGIASVLITTGKHKLRVEVDAAVTVGIVISLFCACSALGMTLYRKDPLTISYRLMVWSTFFTACLLNGMLLVLVVGNTP